MAVLPDGNVAVQAPNAKTGIFGPAIALATIVLSAVLPMPVHGLIAGLPSICIFHLLTGHPCPGCGLTRSFVCFAHGQIAAAFAYHPLGPILFVAIAAYGVSALAMRGRGTDAFRLSGRIANRVWIAALAALLLVWVLRLAGIIVSPPNL